MEHAIKLLEKERELIVADLKNGKKDRLDDLKEFNKNILQIYVEKF